jgi:hypothetical protein
MEFIDIISGDERKYECKKKGSRALHESSKTLWKEELILQEQS